MQGVEGFDEEAFLYAHRQGEAVVSIRLNPAKCNELSFEGSAKVPWSDLGYYLDKRPSFTFDPLFHAGCYYVQEASSMFLEQAITQLVDTNSPLRVLDLSAAPGGKSTHLQSLLSPDSLLVSNDVIRSRALILKQNIIKWGSSNVIVTSNDPQHFQRLAGFFDVIVVDAPCSGSGLFRKDAEAMNEWSLDNVALCHGRQKRILSDVMPALKENGLLVYSTCSYSVEENEDIADWLLEEHAMETAALKTDKAWGIVESHSKKGAHGYRFYPDKLKGEGFFLSCFRKTTGEVGRKQKNSLPERLSAREKEVVAGWVKEGPIEYIRHGSSVIALPSVLLGAFAEIQSHLFIQYAGTLLGELVRDKLIPDHALAMSPLVSEKIICTDVPIEEAIRYLQRADMQFSFAGKGWQLVCFKGHSLGWINVLPNRINNYYPKEMRILKQRIEPDI